MSLGTLYFVYSASTGDIQGQSSQDVRDNTGFHKYFGLSSHIWHYYRTNVVGLCARSMCLQFLLRKRLEAVTPRFARYQVDIESRICLMALLHPMISYRGLGSPGHILNICFLYFISKVAGCLNISTIVLIRRCFPRSDCFWYHSHVLGQCSHKSIVESSYISTEVDQ